MQGMYAHDGVLGHASGKEYSNGSDAGSGERSREPLRHMPRSRQLQKENKMMTNSEMIKAALAAGTKEKAQELVAQQVAEMTTQLDYKDPADARQRVLKGIGYYTGYLARADADKVMELFDTEHPVFGRTHPTAEEAYRLGKLFGEKMRIR